MTRCHFNSEKGGCQANILPENKTGKTSRISLPVIRSVQMKTERDTENSFEDHHQTVVLYAAYTLPAGLAIRGNDCQNNKDSVRAKVNEWVKGLGF